MASSAVWQIRGFVELMDEEPRHAHRDDAGSQRLQKCLGSLPATTVPVRATVMDPEKTIPAVSPCLFMSCVRAWSSGRHTAKQYSWSCADRALPSGGAPGRCPRCIPHADFPAVWRNGRGPWFIGTKGRCSSNVQPAFAQVNAEKPSPRSPGQYCSGRPSMPAKRPEYLRSGCRSFDTPNQPAIRRSCPRSRRAGP